MKSNLHFNALLLKITVLVSCFMLTILYNKSKAESITPIAAPKVSALMAAKVGINFQHDVVKNELNVTVQAPTETSLQLFIFTLDGKLVKEVVVTTLSITTIRNLEKGYYMYECFNKDTRMKNGTLLIK